MAVRIDIDALRDAAGVEVCAAADRLTDSGQPAEVVPVGGGASGLVHEVGRPPYEVWVGVTADGFTAECDCTTETDLCAHAVALTAAALADGLAWSSTATPQADPAVDPRVAELTVLARGLPARRLAALVAEWAATDPVWEGALRAQAGQPAPLTATEPDGN
ncbi:hypothetical protein TPA0907_11440 [Micromonospora humidisoli]|uniref:SWIM-type domain-containing protein n=1 Tax=Micromonospora humidisoli TaxID=2807622 RepID=A0ABS2JBS7_9ACTN|nr:MULTISPECIES: hypothetical protein [Micromonospora]MBM7083997.1 hypothetical protein [Micromonospora humidisoli]GHJ06777.1 hypothetical protein TPA0907_11440 [Micromonospora sp. AKA109]